MRRLAAVLALPAALAACANQNPLEVTVSRGPALAAPALASQDITLAYFVAILRDNNQVVTKKVFETTLRFDPGQERTGTREVIVHRLPDITRARRYDYELLVGFQLSPDELAYNVLR